uniref:Multifunctional fusion protein n=1 Tax=Pterocladia lucida TaxID=31408 RepID=A0A6M3WW23_PTELU|nr:tsf [Pterocladia lucida]
MSIQISAQSVKELRNKTGAGVMDCKKALQASKGNMSIAIESLRKKGLASADKKLLRVATEGLIESYIHIGSRVGVLVELNCETDFVAKRSEFQKLSKDIAMQIVACPSIRYIDINSIPKNIVEDETRIEFGKEDIVNKSEEIKQKIVQGRINKRLKEITLVNQPFIRNQDITIEELIKKHISLLGENIRIRRFKKFVLGEGLDKKEDNFKGEVASVIQ